MERKAYLRNQPSEKKVRNETDIAMLIKLADIFDVSLDELVGRETKKLT
ncbi:MAG: hypothetical protein FWH03_04400 [Firmicutes bacterium]|nr:hypothetical protein [Bacillota bacterium]